MHTHPHTCCTSLHPFTAVPPMIAVVASLPLPPLDVPTLPPALLPSPALQPQEPRGVPVAEEPQVGRESGLW